MVDLAIVFPFKIVIFHSLPIKNIITIVHDTIVNINSSCGFFSYTLRQFDIEMENCLSTVDLQYLLKTVIFRRYLSLPATQWPFQEPKLEILAICKAHGSGNIPP